MSGDHAPQDALAGQCMAGAIDCYATAYIFEQRAAKLRCRLLLVRLLGISVPALLGYVASGPMSPWATSPYVAVPAFALGGTQLLLSLLGVAAGWEEALAYALESKATNYELALAYSDLATPLAADDPCARAKYEITHCRDRIRRDSDIRVDISDREKHRGHRAALRQYQWECAGCKKVPTTMTPTECDVCGRF